MSIRLHVSAGPTGPPNDVCSCPDAGMWKRAGLICHASAAWRLTLLHAPLPGHGRVLRPDAWLPHGDPRRVLAALLDNKAHAQDCRGTSLPYDTQLFLISFLSSVSANTGQL